MRTDPIENMLEFLTGMSSFHVQAGAQGYVMVPLFYILLIASVVIAWRTWQRDPTQRTIENLVTWFFRTMIGIMWFEGSVWKLPLPESGGFAYWVDQMAAHAAFGIHRWAAAEIYKPILPVLNPAVFLTELAMAASFMLGFGVRLMGVVGMLFAFHLYLGLYRHPAEWPWLFFFLIFVQGYFVLYAAGRSLGLDHRFRQATTGFFAGRSGLAALYRRAS